MVTNLLVEQGGSPRTGESNRGNGNSLFSFARGNYGETVVKEDRYREMVAVVRRLVELGCNPNQVRYYGDTPLLRAVLELQPYRVKALLEVCPDVDVDYHSQEPWSLAHVDPKRPYDSYGATGLLHAVGSSVSKDLEPARMEIIRMLLDAGADSRKSPFRFASAPIDFCHNDEIRKLLQTHRPKPKQNSKEPMVNSDRAPAVSQPASQPTPKSSPPLANGTIALDQMASLTKRASVMDIDVDSKGRVLLGGYHGMTSFAADGKLLWETLLEMDGYDSVVMNVDWCKDGSAIGYCQFITRNPLGPFDRIYRFVRLSADGKVAAQVTLPKGSHLPNAFFALDDGRAVYLTYTNDDRELLICLIHKGEVDWQIEPKQPSRPEIMRRTLGVDTNGKNVAIVILDIDRSQDNRRTLFIHNYDDNGIFVSELQQPLPGLFFPKRSFFASNGQWWIVGGNATDPNDQHGYVAVIDHKGRLKRGIAQIDNEIRTLAVSDSACWVSGAVDGKFAVRRIASDMIHENIKQIDVALRWQSDVGPVEATGPNDAYYFVANSATGRSLYVARFVPEPETK